jgi:hypothetical protein
MHALDLDEEQGEPPVGYPPDYLEPYAPDDREPAEWTSELRKLCGRREAVGT